jgi:hypothetical protein
VAAGQVDRNVPAHVKIRRRHRALQLAHGVGCISVTCTECLVSTTDVLKVK